MSINLDTYIECLPISESVVSKDTLIQVLEYSPNFKYNKDKNSIELRTKPVIDTIAIDLNDSSNKEHLPSHDKIDGYINSHLKHLASQTFLNDTIYLRFTSESLCSEVFEILTQIGIKATLEHENIKERIMKSTHIISQKDFHNPRKLSDTADGGNRKLCAHKNSMSTKRFKKVEEQFGYRGKKSFNKYDEITLNQYSLKVPLNKDYNLTLFPKNNQYDFKEISNIFWEMKLQKRLNFPEEWKDLKLEEIIQYEGKTELDHFKKQTAKSNYRERANTYAYEFKSKKV